MKLAFIGLGLVMLVLGYLEYKHWISVNWTVTENQSSSILTHFANKIATVTQHMNHETPIGMGLLGFEASVRIPRLGFFTLSVYPDLKIFFSNSTRAGFSLHASD